MNARVRILIADDSPSARQGLKALLEAASQVEVVGEAGDGKEALRLVAERQPDLVLMDVQMPTMDGLEATRRIKARWPAVRVVALTMHPKYQADASAAGADAFLLKGCSGDMLRDVIHAFGRLRRGQSTRPASNLVHRAVRVRRVGRTGNGFGPGP